MDRQALKNVKSGSWLFGHPEPRASLNSVAKWSKATESPLNQKGAGWLVYLYGGVQTGDDWAACYVPVNELPVHLFDGALWSYYMTATETMGINMVVWVHDPTDFDKRAEVTQLGGASGLEKSSGWNAHEFNTSTVQMFYYGEGTTGTELTAGTQYAWTSFQADPLFKHWTIYRVTFEYGWEASGTFDDAYLAEITMLANGTRVPIPMRPSQEGHQITKKATKTVVGSASSADDVISENGSTGTSWSWDFGSGGYLTKAVILSATNAIAPRCELQLYTNVPTCNLNDNGASTGPVAADVGFFVGTINFPAMSDSGSGHSFAVATPSTYGNLPLEFDSGKVFGVLVDKAATTWGNALVTILLTAELEGD